MHSSHITDTIPCFNIFKSLFEILYINVHMDMKGDLDFRIPDLVKNPDGTDM